MTFQSYLPCCSSPTATITKTKCSKCLKRVKTGECENCNSTLQWTGAEYMYSMLKHNEVELPEEAFVVLRLFPLNHVQREQYCKEQEERINHDALGIVQDFCDVQNAAKTTLYSTQELSEIDYDSLWKLHYSRIFEKYGAERELRW